LLIGYGAKLGLCPIGEAKRRARLRRVPQVLKPLTLDVDLDIFALHERKDVHHAAFVQKLVDKGPKLDLIWGSGGIEEVI